LSRFKNSTKRHLLEGSSLYLGQVLEKRPVLIFTGSKKGTEVRKSVGRGGLRRDIL